MKSLHSALLSMFIALMVGACAMFHSYIHRDDDNAPRTSENAATQTAEAKSDQPVTSKNRVEFASFKESKQSPAEQIVVVIDPALLTGEDIVLQLELQYDDENPQLYAVKVLKREPSDRESRQQHEAKIVNDDSESVAKPLKSQQGCRLISMHSR